MARRGPGRPPKDPGNRTRRRRRCYSLLPETIEQLDAWAEALSGDLKMNGDSQRVVLEYCISLVGNLIERGELSVRDMLPGSSKQSREEES